MTRNAALIIAALAILLLPGLTFGAEEALSLAELTKKITELSADLNKTKSTLDTYEDLLKIGGAILAMFGLGALSLPSMAKKWAKKQVEDATEKAFSDVKGIVLDVIDERDQVNRVKRSAKLCIVNPDGDDELGRYLRSRGFVGGIEIVKAADFNVLTVDSTKQLVLERLEDDDVTRIIRSTGPREVTPVFYTGRYRLDADVFSRCLIGNTGLTFCRALLDILVEKDDVARRYR